jgi:hypothetical protein
MSISLILGAGFSKPMGASLGSEIDSIIFDNIERVYYDPVKNEISNNSVSMNRIYHNHNFTEIQLINFYNSLLQYYKSELRLLNNLGMDKSLNFESILAAIENDKSAFEPNNKFLHSFCRTESIKSLIKEQFGEGCQNIFISEVLTDCYRIFTLLIKKKIEKDIDLNNIYKYEPLIKFFVNNKRLDVLSLNYDNILEGLLKEHEISYSDGFSDKTTPILFPNLNNNEYDIEGFSIHNFNQTKVNLFKLHGSFDWGELVSIDKFKISVTETVKFNREKKDYLLNQDKFLFFEPTIIAGNRRKEEIYLQKPFQDILFSFQMNLLTKNTIIVIGYSFADNGVNSLLINWLERDTSHKIIVIDPYINVAENLFIKPFFQSRLRNQIELINIRLEDITIEEHLKNLEKE